MKKLFLIIALALAGAATSFAQTPAAPLWALSVGGGASTSATEFGKHYNWLAELGVSRKIGFTTLSLRQSGGYARETRPSGPGPVSLVPYSVAFTGIYGDPQTETRYRAVAGAPTTSTKDVLSLRTEVSWDLDVRLSKRLTLSAGPLVGANYGSSGPVLPTVGPEAQVSYDLTARTSLFVRASYSWVLDPGSKPSLTGPREVRGVAGLNWKF